MLLRLRGRSTRTAWNKSVLKSLKKKNARCPSLLIAGERGRRYDPVGDPVGLVDRRHQSLR
jgi:hypothetical protein